ncbi:MAG: DUF3971 domain-containing protein, partial [Pseudomonadota bacterium]
SGLKLDEEKLRVEIESAKSGGLSITSATLDFVDIIEKGAAKADLTINTTGELREVFSYISNEPIGFNNKYDPEETRGAVSAQVNLKFPASGEVKKEEMVISAQGQAIDVNLPDVVQDLDVAGGPFVLKIADNSLTINGEGTIDGRALDLNYQAFLDSTGKDYDTKITAKLAVDEKMRTQLGIDLSDFLEGTAQVNANYTEYDSGLVDIAIDVDLIPAKLFVKPFDYVKLPGVNGKARLVAHLDASGTLKDVRSLTAEAPSFVLNNGDMNFRQIGTGEAQKTELASGKVESFVVNKTMGAAEFEITPAGQVKIVVSGQVVDLSPVLNDSEEDKLEAQKGYEAPPFIVSVSADRMLTQAGKQYIKDGKIYADIDRKGRFNQLEMDGIAGDGQIYLRYKPDEQGMRTFRLEADDAGSAFKVFGLYDHIVGGQLVIYGEPINGIYGRDLRGTAQVNNFKVVNAPRLARLLGTMTGGGLADSLRGKEGLVFSKLESKFVWDYQTLGSVLSVSEGRTSGNSLGLTFDGKFDQRAGTVDVNGTIVPLSGINKIVGSIPLIGELFGGDDGLFAATYTMTGSSKEPEIKVNPLSVLAPGIIRKILFENSASGDGVEKKIQEKEPAVNR